MCPLGGEVGLLKHVTVPRKERKPTTKLSEAKDKPQPLKPKNQAQLMINFQFYLTVLCFDYFLYDKCRSL